MEGKLYQKFRNFPIRSTLVWVYQKYLAAKRELHLATTKPRFESKIFCIGYQKTGTTTLGRSLKILGYRHSSFDRIVYFEYYKKNLNIEKIIDYTTKFDSFDDMPWSKEDVIPILDQTFPNSKFIYLCRDEESWKTSFYNWEYKKFGRPPDVDKAWSGYQKHQDFVMDYFQGRIGKDLIVLDVKDPKGFRKLGDFLGKEAPIDNFPHFNKTELVPSKRI